MIRHLFVLPLVAVLAVACTRHTETPSPFTSPAAELKRIRVEEAYLWEVVKKVRNSRFQADVSQKERITVVRIVIARDGRLLDAQVVGSSGLTEIDHNILAALRQGSPYAPLPPEIPGESASFRLRLASVPEH
jgi:protein TonB